MMPVIRTILGHGEQANRALKDADAAESDAHGATSVAPVDRHGACIAHDEAMQATVRLCRPPWRPWTVTVITASR